MDHEYCPILAYPENIPELWAPIPEGCSVRRCRRRFFRSRNADFGPVATSICHPLSSAVWSFCSNTWRMLCLSLLSWMSDLVQVLHAWMSILCKGLTEKRVKERLLEFMQDLGQLSHIWEHKYQPRGACCVQLMSFFCYLPTLINWGSSDWTCVSFSYSPIVWLSQDCPF